MGGGINTKDGEWPNLSDQKIEPATAEILFFTT